MQQATKQNESKKVYEIQVNVPAHESMFIQQHEIIDKIKQEKGFSTTIKFVNLYVSHKFKGNVRNVSLNISIDYLTPILAKTLSEIGFRIKEVSPQVTVHENLAIGNDGLTINETIGRSNEMITMVMVFDLDPSKYMIKEV